MYYNSEWEMKREQNHIYWIGEVKLEYKLIMTDYSDQCDHENDSRW